MSEKLNTRQVIEGGKVTTDWYSENEEKKNKIIVPSDLESNLGKELGDIIKILQALGKSNDWIETVIDRRLDR